MSVLISCTVVEDHDRHQAADTLLPRHDTQPGSELPALAESSAVADRRDDGCRNDWSGAWDLANAGAGGIGIGRGGSMRFRVCFSVGIKGQMKGCTEAGLALH